MYLAAVTVPHSTMDGTLVAMFPKELTGVSHSCTGVLIKTTFLLVIASAKEWENWMTEIS